MGEGSGVLFWKNLNMPSKVMWDNDVLVAFVRNFEVVLVSFCNILISAGAVILFLFKCLDLTNMPHDEAGNVPYVVENGSDKFSKSPKEIAKIVYEWFVQSKKS